MSAVILAGRLRQATLEESLNLHVLCLPVGRSGTLLEAWLGLLREVPNLGQVRVVVNTEEDAAAVRGVLPREFRDSVTMRAAAADSVALPNVEVMAEPASWRGASGIVRDVTNGLPDDAIVLVCEGARLPPVSLDPMVKAMTDGAPDEQPAGVVGICHGDSPAGVYAFRRKAMRLVPKVGYFDMKEQLLPSLAKAGERVIIAPLTGEVSRLSDLEAYLATIRGSLNDGEGASPQRVSSRASVSGSAVLDGFCIIEPGAVVEDGAVVHDSVVLWGATVGGGAVVSRSIVGPLANIEPRARVVRAIVARPND